MEGEVRLRYHAEDMLTYQHKRSVDLIAKKISKAAGVVFDEPELVID